MILNGRSRPDAPQIDNALDQICSGFKEPKQVLDDAAAKSAKALEW
jgi:multiple sugar transport system substrate-binding protein